MAEPSLHDFRPGEVPFPAKGFLDLNPGLWIECPREGNNLLGNEDSFAQSS